MGSQLGTIIFNFLVWFRWVGMIVIAIVCLGVLIAEAVKSRLSPSRVLTVAFSGLLAAMVFWALPTALNYVRVDTNTRILPDQPIGGVYGH